uniref:Uncharacterized protein n=1 Tax=Anguilla anguilla TaxID=7936 RepID=A0A0E9WLH4_ANGAN
MWAHCNHRHHPPSTRPVLLLPPLEEHSGIPPPAGQTKPKTTTMTKHLKTIVWAERSSENRPIQDDSNLKVPGTINQMT